MDISDDERKSKVSLALQEALNTHGYAFQQAVIRLADELQKANRSAWVLEQTELPVELRGQGTRIDFVLRRVPTWGVSGHSAYLMLAECKRANPAYSDWCFVRTPYISRTSRDGYIYLNTVRVPTKEEDPIGGSALLVEPYDYLVGTAESPSYQIGIEVKRDERGDRHGSGKGAIEEGATQVLRGMNGMLQFLAGRPNLLPENHGKLVLIPVIFTTAHLWVSDADIGAADLHSGNIDLAGSGFMQTPWLFYQYNLSPGLQHLQPFTMSEPWRSSLSDIVAREYVRTIAVVSASGIAKFLDWSHHIDIR